MCPLKVKETLVSSATCLTAQHVRQTAQGQRGEEALPTSGGTLAPPTSYVYHDCHADGESQRTGVGPAQHPNTPANGSIDLAQENTLKFCFSKLLLS